MMLRRTETALAWVSTGVLASYVPVETIYSWSGGLGSPYYIIDIIAFALILAGELLADVLGHGGCEAHQTPDVTVALARRAGRWTILEFLDPNRHGEGVIPLLRRLHPSARWISPRCASRSIIGESSLSRSGNPG